MDRKWPPRISYPTTLPLPSTTLLPSSHPIVRRTLNRLTRPALLSLALDWLSDINQLATAPYLLESRNDTTNELFPPASSLDQLRKTYSGLEKQGGTKRDVLERILEGDWRHGISLYALAMADMQFLYSHPSSQNWLAWEILPLSPSSSNQHGIDRAVPCFRPSIFLRNMQHECLPDIKVHFNIDRHVTLPLLILRVWILETPYNSSFSLVRSGRTFLNNSLVFYIAFPDFSPYVYISSSKTLSKTSFSPISKAGGSQSLRKLVMDAIPKAYSKPGERYRLRNTNFSAKSLEAIIEHWGNGRMNSASAAWATYAETHGREAIKDNPLDTTMATYSFEYNGDSEDEKSIKESEFTIKSKTKNYKHRSNDDKLKATSLNNDLAKIRFGRSALPNDGKGIERLYIRFEDPFPNHPVSLAMPNNRRQIENQKSDHNTSENKIWRPEISLVFTGSHVFAGIRELVEYNIIDGLRMPGWMTGEQGISEGVIRNGRIVNYTKS
ncbi:Inner kinetochore subunit CHL4 [Erysiphe neolycopersici]|uniref:Inner kinetochore subunit CHL4 n=1 Tax=Erysiphe neolycopersici TaxID=212602 RepID=A0A420I0J3_9PEZI|nr:Inner kinetochore subunit CHL4 [Erysiphe neolycopersici]